MNYGRAQISHFEEGKDKIMKMIQYSMTFGSWYFHDLNKGRSMAYDKASSKYLIFITPQA